jgi:hypothetical protein
MAHLMADDIGAFPRRRRLLGRPSAAIELGSWARAQGDSRQGNGPERLLRQKSAQLFPWSNAVGHGLFLRGRRWKSEGERLFGESRNGPGDPDLRCGIVLPGRHRFGTRRSAARWLLGSLRRHMFPPNICLPTPQVVFISFLTLYFSLQSVTTERGYEGTYGLWLAPRRSQLRIGPSYATTPNAP